MLVSTYYVLLLKKKYIQIKKNSNISEVKFEDVEQEM